MEKKTISREISHLSRRTTMCIVACVSWNYFSSGPKVPRRDKVSTETRDRSLPFLPLHPPPPRFLPSNWYILLTREQERLLYQGYRWPRREFPPPFLTSPSFFRATENDSELPRLKKRLIPERGKTALASIVRYFSTGSRGKRSCLYKVLIKAGNCENFSENGVANSFEYFLPAFIP